MQRSFPRNHSMRNRCIEVVKNRLYYVSLLNHPSEALRKEHDFFTVDDKLVYWNFFLDFGPLNLGQLYRFSKLLNDKLSNPELKNKKIFFYSSTHAHKRANAVYLISAFSLLYLNRTPAEAWAPFKNMQPRLPTFHDASPCICLFKMTVEDCLYAIEKARKFKFFDFDNFDVDEYERYEQVENGDLNWIVNGRFLAFAGPHQKKIISPEGYSTLVPEDYVEYYKEKNVNLVIRLNDIYYEASRFEKHGIAHEHLYYMDGTTPPDHILTRFLEVCEATEGGIAVHCKAGLGRTGSCIGAYVMKHYGFTAHEIIAWLRICRPGSVIGPQQEYLESIQTAMWREGEAFRKKQREQVKRHETLTSHMTGLELKASSASDARRIPVTTKLSSPDSRRHMHSSPSHSHSTSASALHSPALRSPIGRLMNPSPASPPHTPHTRALDGGKGSQGDSLLRVRRSPVPASASRTRSERQGGLLLKKS
eukprot:TRINITY_DN2716_c0_g1_i1.p1 TRINITY_DN2716_c0_g1~~TRINITY_DN2716_c0_g1_i1.p1  ORF type:complete len:477 (+),score=117.91 TRINITY_DN2716_c0_g1_i1:138-1568(+)